MIGFLSTLRDAIGIQEELAWLLHTSEELTLLRSSEVSHRSLWPCIVGFQGIVGGCSVKSDIVLNKHLIRRSFEAVNNITALVLGTVIPWKCFDRWGTINCHLSLGYLRLFKVLTRVKIEPMSNVRSHCFSYDLLVIDWLIALPIPRVPSWFCRLRRQSCYCPSHISTLILRLLIIGIHLFDEGPPELFTHASIYWLCALPRSVFIIVEDFIVS